MMQIPNLKSFRKYKHKKFPAIFIIPVISVRVLCFCAYNVKRVIIKLQSFKIIIKILSRLNCDVDVVDVLWFLIKRDINKR